MPIRNLVFDWSGTLADDLALVVEATNSIFAAFHKPAWTVAEFRERFYLPFPQFYREYLPEGRMEDIELHYHRAFASFQGRVAPLLPGARELLGFGRRAGMKIYLLSTIHPKHWDEQAAHHQLGPMFDAVYAGAMDKRRTLAELLEAHQLDPRETLFVGDMQHDIDAAHHNHVVSCAVLTGYDSLAKLKRAEPHLLFQDLAGVQRHLERHAQWNGAREGPVVTVGALIFNGAGACLLVRAPKWSNLWGIPGGKVQRGETAEQALRREIREETGLEVAEIQFALVQDCIDCPEFYRPAHFVLLNYLAKVEGPETVQLNDEAEEYRWVDLDRALAGEVPLNGPTRILVEWTRSEAAGRTG